jgi:hypothetical protein
MGVTKNSEMMFKSKGLNTGDFLKKVQRGRKQWCPWRRLNTIYLRKMGSIGPIRSKR